MKTRIFFISFIILSVCLAVGLCGPPDVEDAFLNTEALLKLEEDSLALQAEILAKKAEFLIDSIKFPEKFNFEFLDTSGLSSYNEIIIGVDGVIKVLTDTGMIILSPGDFGIIMHPDFPDDIDFQQREITRWGKDVIIDEDERVFADITVISGNVTVNGYVDGDIVVIGGDIYVNTTGYVDGDAIAVGGRVKKYDGGKVTGSTISIRFPLLRLARGSVYQMIEGIMLLVMIISLVLSALSTALFPRPVDRIADKLLTRPIKSFIFGYISYVGFFLVWLLLLVSVIGIPLAFFGEPVAIIILIILAYAAINRVAGIKFFREQKNIKSFWYGSLVTTGIPFLLLLFGFITDSLVLFIFNMILHGFMLFILLPFGIGAASLARFGFPPRSKKNNTIIE